MRNYLVELKIRVRLVGLGYDWGIASVVIKSNNKYNAVLEAVKCIDLDEIKYMKKHNGIKYATHDNWTSVFHFDIEEVKSVSFNK